MHLQRTIVRRLHWHDDLSRSTGGSPQAMGAIVARQDTSTSERATSLYGSNRVVLTVRMLTVLIAGYVQVAFDPLPASIEHIRGGKLRALGVTTAKRSEALPDIPSVGEHV